MINRRSFVLASSVVIASTQAARGNSPAQVHVEGPLLGHVDATSAFVWARIAQGGTFALEVVPETTDVEPQRQSAEFEASHDFTGRWRFEGLRPATKYRYRLVDVVSEKGDAIEGEFRTAPAPGAAARVSLALGSCATEDAGSRAVWKRMRAEGIDGLVLCGDTPYIDSTDMKKQRTRYREFGAVKEFQEVARSVPVWGTWDDHDFGRNDADGRLRGKENARQAFTEYRALASFGDGKTGIYTKFRMGPVEVLVIDTRWFANTGPSPVNEDKPTLLGAAQWEWLQASLEESTAPWKVLLCGMIWDAKHNGERDHWETYAHERQAIFDFIREKRISGVVLFGGDIHVTRVLRYDAEKTVGYPLYQFISSPIHHRVLPVLNNPHPALLHSSETPNTFLKLTFDNTGDEPLLSARFLDKDGDLLFEEITLLLKDASPRVS